jgi:hypothetical protein
MSDDVLQGFAENIIREVEAGLSSDAPFSEEVFTRFLLERLEDAGHLENTFDLYQEGRIKNASYRIDGYAFDEERSRLDLFTTIYSDELPPSRLASNDVVKAFERALRFASACVDGLASQLEPSNTDASDLARLIETQAPDLTAIRIVCLPTVWSETSSFRLTGEDGRSNARSTTLFVCKGFLARERHAPT